MDQKKIGSWQQITVSEDCLIEGWVIAKWEQLSLIRRWESGVNGTEGTRAVDRQKTK